MNHPFYKFNVSNHALRFDFSSIGKNVVLKSIIYTRTETPDLFSVALVDIYGDGSADDTSVINNGDMEKILVTVFQTFSVFFKNYPESVVAFAGSTPARTRLYRIAISHELSSITKVYNVWGIINDTYQLFQKDQPYIGFLVSLKRINIA